jgi:DDE family transposase/DDE superfamily endonuclease
MPIPIICAHEALCQFAAAFADCFSKPQRKYFVTVLFALLLCEERRTLTALLRRVLEARSLSGLSRFFAKAPWSEEEVAGTWRKRFDTQVRPLVIAAHHYQEQTRPKGPGRPKATVVTGYLLIDDSTHPKPKGRKMGGLGKHWSSTQKRQVSGHSLFQALYVLEGRQCPLPPKMYCTKAVCEKEDKPFQSKIDLAVNCVDEFKPVEQTKTHVLADSWFLCRELWRGCKKRGFDISGGLKSNRKLRCQDAEGRTVYRSLDEYAASLTPEQFTECVWPSASGGNCVFVHRVRTFVKKLGACQVLVVRHTADAGVKQTRYFVSSLLEADTETILNILAIRWKIETFFDDLKELFGSDHYQVMSARSILRFWTLACCGYVFLEEQRASRGEAGSSIGTIRRKLYNEHQRRLFEWLLHAGQNHNVPHELIERLAA